ncbi:MAG: serine/threonine-protein kinase [Anaerolineaceae bacterium]
MADTLPPNIPRVLKHYRLIRRLGTGGMGSVFEAEDRRDRTRVAVKFLHPHLAEDEAFRERFEREAHVAALLRSPYTVRLLDYGQAEGHLFLVMEYAGGPSVAKLLEERPLSPMRAVRSASEVARALEEAEARGVVHRDIKPENILIVGEDTVKVADFGIARRVGGGGVTEVGGFVGSILYASPEQARGEADRRSDIYALGAVLYSMVAGHPPYSGSPLDVMRQHAESSLPVGPLHNLPDPFVNIVRRCLEKDPQDRYQSASELAGALERVQRYLRASANTATAAVAATAVPPVTIGPPSAPATTLEAEAEATRVASVANDIVGRPGSPTVAAPVAGAQTGEATIIAQEKTVAAFSASSERDSTIVAPAILVGSSGAVVPESGRPGDRSGSAAPSSRAPTPPAQGSLHGSGRKRMVLAGSVLVGVAAIAVLAVGLLRARDESGSPGEVGGAELVNLLDDQAPEAFRAFGTTTSRVSRSSATAADEGAIDSVRVSSTFQGITSVVEMVVFPSTANARRYLNALLQQSGVSGSSGCSSGPARPDAPITGDSRTCYQREGDVVVIASVTPPADVSEAEALARRSAEVISSVRNGETPPRATALVARATTVSQTPAGSLTAVSATPPSLSPTPVPTSTVRPAPTSVPFPISSGVWTYDFEVTSNSCPFGRAVGSRFPTTYLLEEVGTEGGFIFPGELVDVTQEGSNFYIGRFTFTFPTFEFSYPLTTAGESGSAKVTNTYQDANTGTANLIEVYFLRAGGSCTFLSTDG